MNCLGRVEYHDEISFYVNSKLELNGKILIDKNSYCEGIIHDNYNNSYFVFGTFVKFNYLDLYIVINNSQVYRYCATKGYLKYNGKYSLVNSDIEYDFYLKVRGLNVDSRECGSNNPMYLFLEELNKFRDNWLLDSNNNSIYNELVPINDGRSKLQK